MVRASVVTASFVCFALLGCHAGVAADSLASYKADTLPYEKGVLVVAGSQLNISVVAERKPAEVVFFLKSDHGVTFEHEAYRFDKSRFSLWRAGGELYDPVIPLLIDPIIAGSKWDWSGKMILAADGTPSTSPESVTPANATVSLSNDKLNLRAGAVDAMRVDVLLKMDSGGPTKAERKLSFWFVKGQGLVKREFAASSTRIPAEAGP